MRSSSYFKTISRILILAMFHLCWLTSYGYAEMLPTESANQSTIQDDRQRILDLLNRQDVIDELEKYGISKVEAIARINSLTDEEVTMIAGKLNQVPQGSQAEIGGAILLFGVPLALFILYFTLYIAFLPIAAGVCVFVEGPYSECIEDYWELFFENALFNEDEGALLNEKEENECTKKCGAQWKKCYKPEDYNEELFEIKYQCNFDHAVCLKSCEIEEEKKKEPINMGKWCQHPVTNEYFICEDQQLKERPRSFLPQRLKEGQKWCQHPDTNEYYSCEVQ